MFGGQVKRFLLLNTNYVIRKTMVLAFGTFSRPCIEQGTTVYAGIKRLENESPLLMHIRIDTQNSVNYIVKSIKTSKNYKTYQKNPINCGIIRKRITIPYHFSNDYQYSPDFR